MREVSAVVIYCDGNSQIGYGHIKRSLALAEQLSADGIKVFIKGLSTAAAQMIGAVKQTEFKADIVIFDSPLNIDTLLETARSDGQMTVTLDWFGNAVPDINIAVYAHGKVMASRTAYCGFEYVIIRNEITTLPQPAIKNDIKKVMVCLGGGDLLGQGYETAAFLSEEGFDVTLVQGPLAKKTNSENNFSVVINPPNFPALIAGTDWAVTNGGGCFFEALYLGKPTVVLPQTNAEIKIANFAEDRGAAVGIGKEGLLNIRSSDTISIVKAAKELIDGKGLKRISHIIKSLAWI
jgi:spore coat polysaccharide biosynthesis predicted glycosyltransferase SpsG